MRYGPLPHQELCAKQPQSVWYTSMLLKYSDEPHVYTFSAVTRNHVKCGGPGGSEDYASSGVLGF